LRQTARIRDELLACTEDPVAMAGTAGPQEAKIPRTPPHSHHAESKLVGAWLGLVSFNAAPARSPGRAASVSPRASAPDAALSAGEDLAAGLADPAEMLLQCRPGSVAGEDQEAIEHRATRFASSMRPRLARWGGRYGFMTDH